MSLFWFIILAVAAFSLGFWLTKRFQRDLTNPQNWNNGLPTASQSKPQIHAGAAHTSIQLNQQIRQLMAQGKHIEAIKLVRQQHDWSLQEARFYVQQISHMENPDEPLQMPTADTLPTSVQLQVQQLIANRQKIAAIKLVRENTGWGIRKAKDYVEQLGH
jgi:ribosomal protein L7/L12